MQDHLMPGGPFGAAPQYHWQQDRRLPFGVAGVALLIAGAFWKEAGAGFYTFERCFICLVAAALAYSEDKRQRPIGAVIAVGVAVLFNPVFPVHLERAAWFPADLAAAAWLGWIALEGLASFENRSVLKVFPALAITFAALFTSVKWEPTTGGPGTMTIDTNMTTENVTTADTAAMDAAERWKDLEPKASPVALEKVADARTGVTDVPFANAESDERVRADAEEADAVSTKATEE